MDWRDEGAIIAVRRHGESAAIIEVFTAEHGRHAGVVRGGAGRKMAPLLQPGAQVAVEWRARLEDHLGAFRVEPLRSRAGDVFADRRALAALTSFCALASAFLPEREAHPALYAHAQSFLDALSSPNDWPAHYARWELALLADLGFGLDLSACAATGATQELIYVSPKSGRAVSRAAGAPYADRMLSLPAFLHLPGASAAEADFAAALRLTGHFIDRWLSAAMGRETPPAARRRLAELIGRDDRDGMIETG